PHRHQAPRRRPRHPRRTALLRRHPQPPPARAQDAPVRRPRPQHLWNKTSGQVTVYATITETTLTALADLLNPAQDGYHDTAAPAPASNTMWALPQHPITGWLSQIRPGRGQGTFQCEPVTWLTSASRGSPASASPRPVG